MQSPDRFGALLALGLVAWVAAETLINVGAVVGVLPGHRDPAAVHLLRRLVARDHDGGGRHPDQRRPAGRGRRTALARGHRGQRVDAGSRPPRDRRPAAGAPRSVSARRGTVIAGGGTGGHIVPSLQIARALVDRGHAADTIELYGSRRGQEATTWPTLGVPLHAPSRPRAPAQPAARRLVGQRGRGRRARPGPAPRALGSFLARRPRVVVVVGGYASFPAGLAAVADQGAARLGDHRRRARARSTACSGRFAAANAVAFAGTDLPRAARHRHAGPARAAPRWTGRPRAGAPAGRRSACRPTARPSPRVGGSLGAAARQPAPWPSWPGPWADCGGPHRSTTSPVGVTTRRSRRIRVAPVGAAAGEAGGGSGRRAALPRRALRGPHARPLRRRPTCA